MFYTEKLFLFLERGRGILFFIMRTSAMCDEDNGSSLTPAALCLYAVQTLDKRGRAQWLSSIQISSSQTFSHSQLPLQKDSGASLLPDMSFLHNPNDIRPLTETET